MNSTDGEIRPLAMADGAGFGRLAIRGAVDRIVTTCQSHVFLHCFKGNGFLPGYYSRLGFEALSETELDNGPWVLLKYPAPTP